MRPRRFPSLSCLFACAATTAGCAGDDPVFRVPPAPSLVATSFDDGAPVSPTGALALDFSLPLDVSSAGERSLLLVRGTVDDDERRALERGDIRDDLRDRLAPLRIALAGARVTLSPSRPLVGSTRYTLVATTALRSGGRRLADTAMRGLRTRPAGEGAPWIELVAPPAGASDVVRNLRRVSLRFNRPVTGADEESLRLVDEEGESIAARVAAADDAPRGFHLLLQAPLRALRRYHVEAGDRVRDEAGQPPYAYDPAPGFTAGIEVRELSPTISMIELQASSGCLVASFTSARPAAARLCVDGDCVDREEPRVLHRLERPLGFGAAAQVKLEARDESSAAPAHAGPLPAPATSTRTLVITEVLAHARSGALAGQFVELRNVGAAPVATGGLELHDERGGSALPDAVVAPGAFALVVPQGYAPAGGPEGDPSPAPGTTLLRVAAGHLGGNGVRQSGEAIELREADGRPLSRFSTVGVTLSAGQSARRAAPCDRDGAWESTPGGGSTPGGP